MGFHPAKFGLPTPFYSPVMSRHATNGRTDQPTAIYNAPFPTRGRGNNNRYRPEERNKFVLPLWLSILRWQIAALQAYACYYLKKLLPSEPINLGIEGIRQYRPELETGTYCRHTFWMFFSEIFVTGIGLLKVHDFVSCSAESESLSNHLQINCFFSIEYSSNLLSPEQFHSAWNALTTVWRLGEAYSAGGEGAICSPSKKAAPLRPFGPRVSDLQHQRKLFQSHFSIDVPARHLLIWQTTVSSPLMPILALPTRRTASIVRRTYNFCEIERRCLSVRLSVPCSTQEQKALGRPYLVGLKPGHTSKQWTYLKTKRSKVRSRSPGWLMLTQ